MTSNEHSRPTPAVAVTVLGIGNPIMGDDGVGLAVLEELMRDGTRRPVTFVDGGTVGMALMPTVADADSLLVLDAVAAADPPGTVVDIEGDQVPRLLRGKISPHQVGLLDVLAGVRLLGTEPRRMAVVGVVPEFVDLRVGLSPAVAGAVPAAAARAREILAAWWQEDDDADDARGAG